MYVVIYRETPKHKWKACNTLQPTVAEAQAKCEELCGGVTPAYSSAQYHYIDPIRF